MADVTIKKMDNGPLQVKGEVRLEDGKGNTYDVKDTFFLCRCGHSANKPFCDGAHKAKGFEDDSTAK
ncbi:MAG: CDGSH iron-sulfur domain-containing protein [Bacillaceae bacterium]|nr:CDGSH iron-sulfur domain-containing protein [Bacillaceae bacterium]